MGAALQTRIIYIYICIYICLSLCRTRLQRRVSWLTTSRVCVRVCVWCVWCVWWGCECGCVCGVCACVRACACVCVCTLSSSSGTSNRLLAACILGELPGITKLTTPSCLLTAPQLPQLHVTRSRPPQARQTVPSQLAFWANFPASQN